MEPEAVVNLGRIVGARHLTETGHDKDLTGVPGTKHRGVAAWGPDKRLH